ncbi:MAG: hypothetical protein IT196_02845 [Acidimicrobiales bacterium]|nr:hypothetical protein [Acidimicrobiales bacterium]
MTPGRLAGVLDRMLTGMGAGGRARLDLPAIVGAGLPPAVRTRLNDLAGLVTPDGGLSLHAAQVSQTATGVTVAGLADAIGLENLDVVLRVDQDDTVSLTLRAPAAGASVHRGLRWAALALDLTVSDAAPDPSGTFTGSLEIVDQTITISTPRPNQTVEFDRGTWTLDLAAGAGLNPSSLLGSETWGVEHLLDLLPALAGTSPATGVRWTTGGAVAALSASWPLAAHLDLWDGQIGIAVTTARVQLSPPDRSDLPWDSTVQLDGAVTVLGTTVGSTVSLRSGPRGVLARVEVTPTDPAVLTVGSLVPRLTGVPFDDVLAAGPASVRAKLAATGVTRVAVETGPGRDAIAVEVDGTFLGLPTRARVGTFPWDGAQGVELRLRLDGAAATIADVLQHDLGLVVPQAVAAHLPTIGVAPRELAFDSRTGWLLLGGNVDGQRWAADLRVGLGIRTGASGGDGSLPSDGAYRFEMGSLYGTELAPPSLADLLTALLPAGAHGELFAGLTTHLPAGLNTVLTDTAIASATVSWRPATASDASELVAYLVGSVPYRGGALVSSLHIERCGSELGGDGFWNVQLVTPFLRTSLSDLVDLFHLPTSVLGPQPVDVAVTLQSVDLTPQGITITTEVEVNGIEADLTVSVGRTGTAWSGALRLGLGGYGFELAAQGGPHPRFTASLLAPQGGASLAALAELLGAGPLPDALDLSLDDVALVLEPGDGGAGLSATIELAGRPLQALLATAKVGTPAVRAVATAITFPDVGLGFADLPVVGHLLPPGDVLVLHALALQYASRDLTGAEVADLNQLVANGGIGPAPGGTASSPAGGAGSTPPGMAAGVSLSGSVRIGGSTIDLATAPAGPRAPAPAPPAGPTVPAATATAPALTWTSIDKAIGPLHLSQFGVGHADGLINVGVTGSVDLAALELTLVGLLLAVPVAALSDPAKLADTTVSLDGLGVDVRLPSVEIGGALIRRADRIEGAALLRAQGLSLHVLALLERTANGELSAFLYGVLDRPLGGPSFLFVTGLAAGFGYNRALVLPEVEEVQHHLLVSAAVGNGARADSIDDLIGLLDAPGTGAAFPPRAGAMFVAAGVKFTTFRLAESFVVLTVSWGAGTRISLLGTSTIELPPTPPGVSTGPPPLARVSLAVRAVYDVERGALDVRGLLVNSYILSSKATLRGGFAVLAFVKDDEVTGARAGHFVATVGGYHPRFAPEPWYPTVPRLALDWQVSPNLGVTGSAYFALTPHAAMAGGSLDAHWEAGGLSARFTLAADFLIQWEPYHYEASFSMGLHGSLDWGSLHLSVSLHAAVEVYGPPFGGKAVVDLDIVSTTIEFGAGRPVARPLPVDAFVAKFLPPPPDICGAAVTAGAIGQDPADKIWMVSANALELAVHSAVPATALFAGSAALEALRAAATVSTTALDVTTDIAEAVLLVPCGLTGRTPFAYSVVRHDHDPAANTTAEVDVTASFTADVVTKAQPGALWATADPPPSGGHRPSTAGGATGVTLRPIAPAPVPHTASIPLDALRAEVLNGTHATELAAAAGLRTRLAPLHPLTLPVPEDQIGPVRSDLCRSFGFDPATVTPRPRPTRGAVGSLACTDEVPS